MDKGRKVEPEQVRWTIEVAVDRIWVEDGYYLTDESVKASMDAAMTTLFPGAYKKEVVVRLIKGPPVALIRGMQKH
jgi:hypothetical protein